MAITVTATQGGSTANGMLLRVFVLTGAKLAASQTGGSAAAFKTAVTAFTLSITTSTASNVYGASSHDTNGTTATGSNATVVDDILDSTNGERYVTFKALNVAAGAATRGFTVAGSTSSGPMAMLEILASGTLAEDGSAPAVASTTTATTVTTASFTPPGGALLVALVASDGGVGVTTMTVSGGGLTWTEIVKNNVSGGDYAGVWIADVPAAGGVAGRAQPRPSLTPPRRKPARAVTARQKGGIAPAGIIQPLPTIPVPRRRPSRAVVEFTPVATVNQVPAAAPPGTVQPGPTLTPPRRRPSRAVVEFTPVTTTNLVPGRQQPLPTFPQQRRRLVRAVIRGQAGTIGIPGTIQPAPTFPQPRRKPARAVIEFIPVTTVNQAGAAGPAGTLQPRPTLTWPRKRPARAGTALLMHPVRTVNQPAAPLVVPVNPLPNGGSTEGALWEMARTGQWPKRPPGFGPVGPVPSSSAVPPKPGERGWVGKRKRRFSWPKQDE